MDRTSGPKRAGGGVGGNKEGSVTRDRDTANSKAIGLNDKLIMQIQEYPELHSLLRLHELNKKVEAKNNNMQDKIDKLQISFKHLGTKIKEVFSEQSMKNTGAPSGGEKDGKKGK